MNADFWQDCWRRGDIGFHQPRVLPLLQKHWPALALPAGSRWVTSLQGRLRAALGFWNPGGGEVQSSARRSRSAVLSTLP